MNTRLKAEIGLCSATIFWGGTFVTSKAGLEHISPMAYVAGRGVLGTLALLFIFRAVVPRIEARDLKAGVTTGTFLFAGYACLTAGMVHTSVSKAAFINSFEAVLPAILLAVFWRRSAPALLWLGALAALVGLYLITVPAGEISGLNRGDILVFCGAILFATHTIAIGFFTQRHELGALTLIQVATTTVLAGVSLPLLTVTGIDPFYYNPAPIMWVALFLSGVGSLAIGLTIQTWAQRHTPASHAAMYFSLIPVFATFASVLFLHERMGIREVSGCVCIFAGVLMSTLSGSSSTEPQPPTADAVEYGVGGGL